MPKKLGRYEIVRELGKGAMGVVYEGRDPNIGRRVAIKTARRDVMESSTLADEMMKRFLREAQAAGALNHPNIITIYDADEEEGIAYIAMEFLEGHDLRKAIEERNRFSVEDIARMGATICSALAVAHDQGIVHRDIKPANILMLPNGQLKLADFGIAHVSDSNLTQDGAMIGTPHYMSPEQFMGQKVDGRADLFSVSVMLYELLTGEKPFGGEALSTVMHKVVKTDPVPPQELNYAIPEPLSRVIMKGLSKRPQARYQDGRAMAAALMEGVKAKPNPAVLMLEGEGGVDTEKTVVSGGAPGGAMGATVPGGAPANTIGSTPTVAAQGPPPGAAVVTTVKVQPQTKKGLPKAVLAGGVAVLVVAAIALGIFKGSGRTTPTEPAETPKVTTGNTGVGKDLVAVPPRVSPQDTTGVQVQVYVTDDVEIAAKINNAMSVRNSAVPGAKDPLLTLVSECFSNGQIEPLQGAKVKVMDGASGQELDTQETNDTGQAQLRIPKTTKTVSYSIERTLLNGDVDRCTLANEPVRGQAVVFLKEKR